MFHTDPVSFFNDATIYGDLETDQAAALFEKPIAVSFGSGRRDMDWDQWSGTLYDLVVNKLSEFKFGAKDGWAMTQGSLAGGQRTANNAVANYVLMIDCDTGETVDAVHERIKQLGLFAIIWTTHSHLKSATDINEQRLIRWCKTNKTTLTADNVQDIVKRYLKSESKITDALADTITSVTRAHGDGGVRYVVHHAPMHRLRVLFVLEQPFVFATVRPTQKEAITAWKDKYEAVAAMLGVAWDQSCTDPSRLMYTPRVAPGATGQELRIIVGDALDLEGIKPATKAATSVNPFIAAGHGSGEPRQDFATKNLIRFIAKHANDFEIVQWLEAVNAEFVGSPGMDKATVACPNAEAHSTQAANDAGFYVENASARMNGFAAQCSHNSCKTESGGDRAWYLDKLCAAYGVADAMELVDWCPNAEDEAAAVIDAVAAAAPNEGSARASADQIREALQRIARVDDPVEKADRLRQLSETSAWTMTELRPLLRQYERSDQADEDATPFAGPPIPDNIDDVSVVWASWTKNDKRKVVKRLIEHRNTKDPVVYKRPEGTFVYVQRIQDGIRACEFNVEDSRRWDALMTDLGIKFVIVDEDTGAEVEEENTPGAILNYLAGSREWSMPPLDRVVRVPIFAADGSLVITPGYSREAGIFFDPPNDVTFFGVSEVPDKDEVADARNCIYDILRDFPFSDHFSGSDPLPIRSDELDEDNFPLPNLERGTGSRANTIAMILQPFMREMIEGPCPNYHIDKPERGTGAGYLVDTAWSIFEGEPRARVQTLSHTNEEIKKSVTSSLRAGASMLFLDNIQHKVENADIAAALTAGMWTDRILGQSENVTIPIRCTWIMAGNRIPFSEDMMRRNVPIFMDAATANPAMDRGKGYYKHDPLHAVLMDRRLAHVWACHTLIQNWIAKGCPPGNVVMQSFTEWANAIGGVLECADIKGFLSNRAEYLAVRNEDQDAIVEVTRRVWLKYRDKPVRITEIFDALTVAGMSAFGKSDETLDPALGLTLGGRDKAGVIKSLGHLLSREYTAKTVKILDIPLECSWERGRDNRGAFYKIVEKAKAS